MGWLLRGIGEFGSQVGEGHDIALDWKLKQQKAQLEAQRQQLDAALLPLQMQEMTARIRKLGLPEQKFITTPRGGTSEIDISPDGSISSPREIVPGSPRTLKEEYEDPATTPERKKAILGDMEAESSATKKLTPLQEAQENLRAALQGGNPSAIQAAQAQLQTLTSASKSAGAPTYWKLRTTALLPGPEGDAARKALAEDEKMQEARLRVRGEEYGKGRLWQMRTYVNAQGHEEDMTGIEYERRKAAGEPFVPSGRLNSGTVIAYQRFRMETVPALQGVEKDLGAFDNAGDRAIFAKIMKSAGTPDHGSEMPWMQNILRQALAEGLSEQGRDLTINLNRLAETMGTLRASLALPSTEQSMLLTLGLLPGAGTPDSRFARAQLANLKSIIDQASNVPIMQNVMPSAGGPGGPPPGARVITLDQLFGNH